MMRSLSISLGRSHLLLEVSSDLGIMNLPHWFCLIWLVFYSSFIEKGVLYFFLMQWIYVDMFKNIGNNNSSY